MQQPSPKKPGVCSSNCLPTSHGPCLPLPKRLRFLPSSGSYGAVDLEDLACAAGRRAPASESRPGDFEVQSRRVGDSADGQ